MEYYLKGVIDSLSYTWMFFVVSAVLIFSGIYRKKNGKSYKRLFLGGLVFSLIIINMVGKLIITNGFEQAVVGNYVASQDSITILSISKTKEFTILGDSSIIPAGYGEWELREGDIIELVLSYANRSKKIWIEVDFSRVPNRLIYHPSSGPEVILVENNETSD